MGNAALKALNVAELRELARRRLPRVVFEYVDRGTEDDLGPRANREALDRIVFTPRMMRDVTRIDLATTLFGTPAAMPVGIAATGGAAMVGYDGDVALARGARAAGVPFMISGAALTDLERIAEVGGRIWFQSYAFKDRAISNALIDRAAAAGCEALVITADTAMAPNREYNTRNGYGGGIKVTPRTALDGVRRPGWVAGVWLRYLMEGRIPGGVPPMGNASLSWAELKTLRARWKGPLVIKGLLSPEDAKTAVDAGCDAVLVSNHGGRNLDHVVPSIEALPRIVDAVGGRAQVFFDSGIRRGSDVVKALALGADYAFVGRATLFGLAAGGEAGVVRALQLLGAEMKRVMGLCGCSTLADIGPELVAARMTRTGA